MKAFQFRLAAALHHRELLLEIAQSELAEALEKLNLATELMEECQSKLKVYVDAAPLAGAQFDPNQDLIRQRHIYHIRQEIDRRQAMIKQLTDLHQEKVSAVAEAHRNVRAMELLEEKEKAAWLLEAKRNEQKELDEFGTRKQR
ncbi:MAG: flagellar export protein FliJ [Bradymonadia bacterium]